MVTPALVPTKVLPLWHQLNGVLTRLADDGDTVPCELVPKPFTSSSPAARAAAARWCIDCPALAACHSFAAANGERWGVWGGIDRSPRPITRSGFSTAG